MKGNYNAWERSVARFLNRFPFVKQHAKNIYSRIMYVRSKNTYKQHSVKQLNAIAFEDSSSFFGYYDKSPENKLGLILACTTSFDTSKSPNLDQDISLCVFDKSGKVVVRIPVFAHNWQQGCRAHWLDDDLFIYNDFDVVTKSYVSRVFSISENKEVDKYNFPVQDSFQREYFISLNYQRLMTLRPDYGYRNLPKMSKKALLNRSDDGLWKIDFKTGSVDLFISLESVCRLKYNDDFSNALHKFNHVMISPDGSNFIFLHRYLVKGQRFDRLIIADSNTGDLRLLSDYGMVSHCYWANEDTVIGYMRGPDAEDSYWLIDVQTAEFTKSPCEALDNFGDGHPHVIGDWFVTDTYPDKSRMQHLLLCNWKTGEVKKLGEFFHGFEFKGESRCDLHPRLSLDGKFVYFDSVFSSKRQLYKMELPLSC